MSTTLTTEKEKVPLLINRKFALLWFGQSISNVGKFFFSTTLYLWIATQLAKNRLWSPLATPLYFAFGIQWAIIIDALSFVISFLAIYMVRLTLAAEKSERFVPRKHFLREFVEGLQFFKGNRVLVVLFVCGILFQFGVGPSDALYVLFAIHNLHTPSNLLGLFEANYGVGVILGLLFAAFCARRQG